MGGFGLCLLVGFVGWLIIGLEVTCDGDFYVDNGELYTCLAFAWTGFFRNRL